MKKKSLAIVGIVGVPASYGGFETLVENILLGLVKELEVTVFCESSSYKNKLKEYKGARLEYLDFRANGAQSIVFDLLAISKASFKFDVILVLGVSAAIFFPFFRLFSNSKIICHIDGLEWKRNKWGYFAKKYLKISEYFAVKFSHRVISDNKAIEAYVLRNYNKSSELITYGADHVIKSEKTPFIFKYSFLEKPYIFTVCRIEPENNIEVKLEAFAKNQIVVPYVVVGNWESSEYGRKLYNKYKDVANIHLLKPIYEPIELNALRSNCLAYLHGHSAGGTNPSLVEAMYLGIPIIAFDVNYNRETTGNSAIFFSNYEELVHVLMNIYSYDLNGISERLKAFAINNYLWQKINREYLNTILSV